MSNTTITALLIVILALSISIIMISKDNSQHPHKQQIGGCKGTEHGCCPDKVSPCEDEKCSNCK